MEIRTKCVRYVGVSMKKYLVGDTIYKAVDLDHLAKIAEAEVGVVGSGYTVVIATELTMEIWKDGKVFSSIKVEEITEGGLCET